MRLGALTGVIAFVAVGCFDEPPLEDRWTRLDLRDVSWVSDDEGVRALRVRGEVTYRAILTGSVGVEVRRSEVFGPDALHLDADDDRLTMARDVARLFEESMPVSGEARLVTGWDHLVQGFEFTLYPAVSGADSTGLFVVFYLGDGERMETEEADTLIVTPWDAEERQVLPCAVPLAVAEGEVP